MHLKESIQCKINLGIVLRKWNLMRYYSAVFDSLHDVTAIKIEEPLKTLINDKWIVGNCNGLFCMLDENEGMLLWNPSTRNHQELPAAPIDIAHLFSLRCGLGYDLLNDDYKVVIIAQAMPNVDDVVGAKVLVYSLKTNSWKRMRDLPYLEFQDPKGLPVSGAMHWVTLKADKSIRCPSVFAYAFVTDRYYFLSLPKIELKISGITMGGLEGCLTVLGNEPNEQLNVWVMKEYGKTKSWSKLFSVKQLQVIGGSETPRPLMYSKNGKHVLLEVDREKIVWFDLETSKVVNAVKIVGFPKYFHMEIYSQCLVPLHCDPKSQAKKPKQRPKKKKNEMFGLLSVSFRLL